MFPDSNNGLMFATDKNRLLLFPTCQTTASTHDPNRPSRASPSGTSHTQLVRHPIPHLYSSLVYTTSLLPSASLRLPPNPFPPPLLFFHHPDPSLHYRLLIEPFGPPRLSHPGEELHYPAPQPQARLHLSSVAPRTHHACYCTAARVPARWPGAVESGRAARRVGWSSGGGDGSGRSAGAEGLLGVGGGSE